MGKRPVGDPRWGIPFDSNFFAHSRRLMTGHAIIGERIFWYNRG